MVTTQTAFNLWGCARFKEEGRCPVCNSILPKRRRRWCSDSCRDLHYNNHIWGMAAWQARIASVRGGRGCRRCGARGSLQVNHIIPVNGMSREGCVSHQENLETLCHPCHVQITKEQRNAGLIG